LREAEEMRVVIPQASLEGFWFRWWLVANRVTQLRLLVVTLVEVVVVRVGAIWVVVLVLKLVVFFGWRSDVLVSFLGWVGFPLGYFRLFLEILLHQCYTIESCFSEKSIDIKM